MHTPSLRTSRAIKKASSAVISNIEQLEPRTFLSASTIDANAVNYIGQTQGLTAQSIAQEDYKEIALNLGGLFYYSSFWPFADALKMESRGFMIGAATDSNNASVVQTAADSYKIDANGFVKAPGVYNAKPFQNGGHPDRAPRGLYTVTWEGDGDVTLVGSNVVYKPELSGPNRRVYQLLGGWPRLQVNNVATGGNYVKAVHLWMPDPDAPGERSLDPVSQGREVFWHPQYLDHLAEVAADSGYFRYMDWLEINASPQVNISDMRPKDSAFANGTTNYKALNVPGIADPAKYGEIGVAWEWIIDLANTTGVNPWICIPHAATDAYVQYVADLFAGKMPELSPGLNAGMKVYVEYSNEIWSNGAGFAQGDWANQQAWNQGITKPAFNGRRSAEVFRIFNDSLSTAPSGSRSNDLIRVAASFSGQTSYSRPYLQAMKDLTDQWINAGQSDNMGDVMAMTTYFGGNALVKYLFNEIDWMSVDYTNPDDPRFQEAFDYWITNIALNAKDLSTGVSKELAQEFGMQYLAYEGGPSIYTEGVRVYLKNGKIVDQPETPDATVTSSFSLANYVKQNYPDDDADAFNADRFTKFIMAMNRSPRMADVYRAQLEVSKARGLKTHAAFTDIGTWNKYGQWGHLEYLGQTSGYAYGDAVKWQFLKDWAMAESPIRDRDDLLGIAPVIPATGTLPSVYQGQSFSYDINALSLGDGDLASHTWQVVAGFLPPGMQFEAIDGDTARISGTPTKDGMYRVMVRLTDGDQDPAYAIYTINVLPSVGVSENIPVTEDAYAYQGQSQTHINGTETTLFAGGGQRAAYLKFDLRNLLVGEIDSAKLRLYIRGYENGVTPTFRQLSLYATSDLLGPNGPANTQWTESNLQWNYAPAFGDQISGTVNPGANPVGWIEFDVSNYLKNPAVLNATDGFVSFAVRSSLSGGGASSFTGVMIASREYAGGDYAPQLVLNQSPADNFTPLRADVQPIVPNPRKNQPVDQLKIVFNKPVTGFDVTDLILKKSGTVLNLSGVTISTSDNQTFTISGTSLSNLTQTSGLYSVTVKVAGSGIVNAATPFDALTYSDTETWNMTGTTTILGRYIFYNNSYFDGNNAGANAADDAAIATDKTPLRGAAGTKATFLNYTSYSKGINGIIIDLQNLPTGELTEADLGFKVGNTATSAGLTTFAVMPDISIRHGGGKNGSDRITLIWPDGLIAKQWLQVTVKATENTGLSAADVFYFGNLVGETGDSVSVAAVDSLDVTRIRDNLSGRTPPPLTSLFDLNRDRIVDSLDVAIARDNLTGRTPLQLITI